MWDLLTGAPKTLPCTAICLLPEKPLIFSIPYAHVCTSQYLSTHAHYDVHIGLSGCSFAPERQPALYCRWILQPPWAFRNISAISYTCAIVALQTRHACMGSCCHITRGLSGAQERNSLLHHNKLMSNLSAAPTHPSAKLTPPLKLCPSRHHSTTWPPIYRCSHNFYLPPFSLCKPLFLTICHSYQSHHSTTPTDPTAHSVYNISAHPPTFSPLDAAPPFYHSVEKLLFYIHFPPLPKWGSSVLLHCRKENDVLLGAD